MGIRQVPMDPGTPGVNVYWPFKVTQLDGDLVSVNPGELFADPLIGGEIADIKGIDVPFRVNETSVIYLQVFFDMVGRITHAGIAHTGKHLQWLLPGEKWLNYPRMYAVNDLPYFGIHAAGEYGSVSNSASGFWPMALHSCGRSSSFKCGGTGPASGGNWRLIDEGWFAQARQEGEGYGVVNAHGDRPGWGINPNFSYRLKQGVDEETTILLNDPGVGGAAGYAYKANQIYTGIDRELRKDICAQGTNVSNPYRRQYPYSLKDVGRYPQEGNNPGNGSLTHAGRPHPGADFSWRRQKMGGWDKSTVPWTPVGRGWDEYGGYMNVGVGVIHAGAPKGAAVNARAEKQSLSYENTHKKIAQGWAKFTVKLHRTTMDQCMAFFPIAYATRPARQLEQGFVSGITVPAAEYGPYTTGPNKGKILRRREFQIQQACKSNLRLATVLEGDARFKAIVPYVGMHTSIPVYEGDLTVDFLNFKQAWPYHAGGWSTTSSPRGNAHFTGPPFSTVRGKNYYRRENAHDLPFNQTYLDAMFNNQTPK